MRFPCLIAVLAILTVPLFAEQTDRSGWQYDAVMPEHLSDTNSPTATDINAVNDLIAKVRDRWNAHDLDGYLTTFWNSPQLMIVNGDDQIEGWQALRESYKKAYSDADMMGTVKYSRTRVKFSKPSLALVKNNWALTYPNQKGDVLGETTMNLQRFDDGWKVISSYSSFVRSTSRGWEYDSIAPDRLSTPSPDRDDVKAINDLLLGMLDRWNAQDVEGYLSAYWKSPQLLVIIQAEQYQGWNSLYDAYKTGYPDPNAMGTAQPSRIQIKLVREDQAVAVTWWGITHANSKVRTVGNTTMNLQKFSDGWKIVLEHSSIAEP